MSGFESVVGINPWTALFTFCNLIITYLVLRKFLFKPVKKMIDDRQKEIDDQYADAHRAQADAQAMKEAYQQHLEQAKAEREEIMHDAIVRAQKKESEIIAAAKTDAAAIRAKAEADIMQEKKHALNQVKSEISDIAMEIASRVVEKEITAQDHRTLVEEFIGKIGDAQ